MKLGSLFIDVGAQSNTAQVAKNAAPVIAEILARTVLYPKVSIAAPSAPSPVYWP